MRASALAALLATALMTLGMGNCSRSRSIEIIAPEGTATGCGVTVEFALVGTFKRPTLEVTLNGRSLPVRGNGPLFQVRVDPGPALVIDGPNTVEVRARRASDDELVTVSRVFTYEPPPATARRIVDPADLIEGPLAHGRPGDYLLENGCARFIVQDAVERDFNQIGAYGGNLIDAELVVDGVRQGNDNFWEVQPAVNIESVIHATSAQIDNDGSDGNPAAVTTCGPDDLLDGINPSSAVAEAGAAPFPPEVDDRDYDVVGCTRYSLARGTRYLTLDTTIENYETVELPLFVGDFVSAAGELEQWTPLPPGLSLVQAGVGELFVNFAVDALTYYGFDAAEGVDYGLVPEPPGPEDANSSTFTTSGVTYMLHHYSVPGALFGGLPAFVVPPRVGSVPGTRTFTRYFTVGDGSGSNSLDVQLAVADIPTGTLSVCVTRGSADGPPVVGARVVAAQDSNGGTTAPNVLRGHWVTGADGCSEGSLPPGSYFVAAAKEGYPYAGGGSTPQTTLIPIAADQVAHHSIVLPDTGRLRVEVVDESNAPMPARVAVVGFDPSPERILLSTLPVIGQIRSAFTYDQDDPIPTGLTRTEYAGADGVLEIDLEPGTYEIAVSRGGEYSLHQERVTIAPNSPVTVSARLVRVLDTPGFISSDYHVHMIDSPDARISQLNRVLSMAGEGVENIVATDHSVVTDLGPAIAAAGLDVFVHSTPGEEITTFDYGHFNAYPQRPDPSRVQTRGSTDWAGAAPPGEDFPSFGNYNHAPAEIEALVMADPDNEGLDTVVQINHFDDHVRPLKIDTSATPPRSFLSPGEPSIYRLDPSIENFFHHFPALEVWNGMNLGHQNEFLDLRIGVWMNLLNRGYVSTAIGSTDTHSFHDLRTGGVRTWTPSSTDLPAEISDNEIGQAIKAGKATMGQGIFVLARLVADSTGETTGFELDDQTIDVVVPVSPAKVVQRPGVRSTDGAVHLDIHVQAPLWAEYDRIEIYSNSATSVTGSNGGVPVLFTAVPDLVLTRANGDFTVEIVDKSPPGTPIPGAARYETHKRVTFAGPTALTQDAWFVVLVKGSPNVSRPMFPVYPFNLNAAQNPTLDDLATVLPTEAGVRALGATNALFADVDGNPGFDPPISAP